MVLFFRFWSDKSFPFGIDMSGWKHNATFRIRNTPDIEFFIQDEYKLRAKEKWQRVRDVIETALDETSTANTWFINYCSAQNWPVQPPRYIAWNINKSLGKFLDEIVPPNSNNNGAASSSSSRSSNTCVGVIVLDFAQFDLVESVFMLNFQKLG